MPPLAADQPYVFSNVETLLVGFLSTRSELEGIPVLVDVSDAYDGASVTVAVTRIGGEFAEDDLLDHALIRIDTYAQDKQTALDIAGLVRGLIWLMPSVALPGGYAVSDVAEAKGPTCLRDPRYASVHRYMTKYHILVRVGPVIA